MAKRKTKPAKAADDLDEAADSSQDEAPAGMGRSLVIVESPAKAKTINKYLGSAYIVRASMGHVRDLPKGRFGIQIDKGFEPDYVVITGKQKVIGELKKLAKAAPAIYLAPDPDREGEAIAWHLSESLGVDPKLMHRVVFNEITEKAVKAAFDHPSKLDMSKVDAQQARRVLDRIMGYKLSPLLWKKVAKGLSAGRVQSVAVRLIVEREKEIRAFIKEEYWRVTAKFVEGGQPFEARLTRLGDTRIDQNLDEKRAKELLARIGKDPLVLAELEEKPKTRPTTPPFTTSQLQQKASTMLRFSAKKTMMVAQRLYEGIEVGSEGAVGLITYMRTDSTRVSDDALSAARALIASDYGPAYLPDKPNFFRTKSKGAQEAHEAIRPTDVRRTPELLRSVLSDEQFKLYKLIWDKFVASQMKPALASITTAAFEHGDARFVAQGEVEVFDGHTRVFGGGDKSEEQALPKSLAQGKSYRPEALDATQHFTQPPPRYSEATLVKELEKRGIGRPSTYATIISTIQDRGYVISEARKFRATELGEVVTDLLVAHFENIINTDYTARMESNLDHVESGETQWRTVVKQFNDVFMADLATAEVNMKDLKKQPILSDKLCDKCGAPMAVLFNKRGKFLGCSRYPECKNAMGVDGPREQMEVVATDYTCPKCQKPMVLRSGSRGKFLACTGFPKCKSTQSVGEDGKPLESKPTGIKCDKCESPMIIKGSKRGPFLACSAYPKCRNAKPLPDTLREKPEETGEKCDKCGASMVKRTSRWGKQFLACSSYPKCKNARNVGAPASGPDSGTDGPDAGPEGVEREESEGSDDADGGDAGDGPQAALAEGAQSEE
jgi:DNA topoisomerase-1